VYRPGHVGVTLLVYAPVGYLLLVDGRGTLAVLGGAIAVALAMIPDFDIRLPGVSHRGATHTLLFALCVGAALGAIGWAIANAIGGVSLPLGEGVGVRTDRVSSVRLGVFAFSIGALTVCSHLLADVLTPMGIAPFWPVSSKRYSFDVVKASNTVANVVLFVLGVSVTLGVLWIVRPAG
jgi:inner membrane protein